MGEGHPVVQEVREEGKEEGGRVGHRHNSRLNFRMFLSPWHPIFYYPSLPIAILSTCIPFHPLNPVGNLVVQGKEEEEEGRAST